jgi:hypothetical protein
VNMAYNKEKHTMRKIIAGIKPYRLHLMLVFIACFIFVVFVLSCENPAGQGTAQQDGGQDDADGAEDGEEADVVLSPGPALPAGSLQDKIAAIAARVDRNVYYDIVVDQDLTCNPMTISTAGTNVRVTLHSDLPATIRTLTLGAPGAIITVDANVTLILENIVLQGQPNNNWELLTVDEEGTLIMRQGAKITGNENTETACGGVAVNTSGTFIMEDGEICYNKTTKDEHGAGAGVFIGKGGYFNLRGGTIHHNEAWDEAAKTGSYGGGVYVYRATFIMNGGEIFANTAYQGGGVYISGFKWSWDYNDLFEKRPLPGTATSGVIWGYPANGKENYANGPAVYYAWNEGYYNVWRESTLGEYDAISTAWWGINDSVVLDLESGWEYRD